MNRKNGICFSVILVLLFISLIVTYYYEPNDNIGEETQLSEFMNEDEYVAAIISDQYEVKEINSFVVVYDLRDNSLFLQTSIKCEDLPLELRSKIQDGIAFSNLSDLYSFLESYSS